MIEDRCTAWGGGERAVGEGALSKASLPDDEEDVMLMRTRRIRQITVAACATPLLAFGGAATAGAATVTVPSVPSVVQQSSAGEILSLVNAEREKAGCSALKSNPELNKIAQEHAEDMAKNNLTGHTGSDGSGVQQRIDKVGYKWSAWGENVSGPGYDSSKAHVDGWLNSPAHKSDMLKCSFTDTGVGVSGDRAVQVFATPG